jgi:dihydroorotase (multifunctional complex type)
MKCDLVVQNCELITPTGRMRSDIGIKNGAFIVIDEHGSVDGNEHINAAGKIVLPGGIDMHVHFRDPGATHKEDFAHGTAAAACGGVTTICDMPNTKPAVVTADHLAAKLAHVSSSAHVDFCLWAGGVAVDQFPAFKRLGAVGLKVYMNRAPPGSQSYSSELSMPDDATFVRVLRAAADLDWPVSVHVANSSLDDAVREQFVAAGRNSARDVCLMTRSPESAEAQARAIHFARVAGARLHIAHISYNSIEALSGLQTARNMGCRVTVEVVPPCLSFLDLDRVGCFGIPFAHPDEENEKYWTALNEELIDVVATDHAPHTRQEKQQGSANAWLAPSGYPAVETMIPLLINAALCGRLTFERLAKVVAENPARICGLASKGAIEVGRDADFIIVDPSKESTVDEARLHTKSGWSPFHGRVLKGRIEQTFLRGTEIAAMGELTSVRAFGKHVRSPKMDGVGHHDAARLA